MEEPAPPRDESASDWHVHTHYSDGLGSVEEVIRKASELGLTRVAITDHDCIEAHKGKKFENTALAHGVYLVTGTEIDCRLGEHETEILGYGFDPEDRGINAMLDRIQGDRMERFQFFCNGLARKGEPVEPGSVLDEHVKVPIKVHLYRALLSAGRGFESGYKEFKALLDSLGAAPRVRKPSIEEAVDAVVSAGGYALLAHPLFYAQRIGLERLLDAGVKAGCSGLELFYPYEYGEKGLDTKFVETHMSLLMDLAADRFEGGARASRGTDVHDLSEWSSRLESVRQWEDSFMGKATGSG